MTIPIIPLAMESSKNLSGSTEGCSSSESGWTTYIASPMEEEDAECGENEDENYEIDNDDANDAEGDNGGQDSDDSMASDASSGPSHRQQKHEKDKVSPGRVHPKHGKADYVSKFSSQNKNSKQEKKKGENSTRYRAQNWSLSKLKEIDWKSIGVIG